MTKERWPTVKQLEVLDVIRNRDVGVPLPGLKDKWFHVQQVVEAMQETTDQEINRGNLYHRILSLYDEGCLNESPPQVRQQKAGRPPRYFQISDFGIQVANGAPLPEGRKAGVTARRHAPPPREKAPTWTELRALKELALAVGEFLENDDRESYGRLYEAYERLEGVKASA